MEYTYKTTGECIEAAAHLMDCDGDGFCNNCGSQARPEDFPKALKTKNKRVRKVTATRNTLVLEVVKDVETGSFTDFTFRRKSTTEPGKHVSINGGLLSYMSLDLQAGDEVEITAKIVSRLKRVRL